MRFISCSRCLCAWTPSHIGVVIITLIQIDLAKVSQFFCMGDGYMILLHGFIKKTQKTPQADITLALKRKREVM